MNEPLACSRRRVWAALAVLAVTLLGVQAAQTPLETSPTAPEKLPTPPPVQLPAPPARVVSPVDDLPIPDAAKVAAPALKQPPTVAAPAPFALPASTPIVPLQAPAARPSAAPTVPAVPSVPVPASFEAPAAPAVEPPRVSDVPAIPLPTVPIATPKRTEEQRLPTGVSAPVPPLPMIPAPVASPLDALPSTVPPLQSVPMTPVPAPQVAPLPVSVPVQPVIVRPQPTVNEMPAMTAPSDVGPSKVLPFRMLGKYQKPAAASSHYTPSPVLLPQPARLLGDSAVAGQGSATTPQVTVEASVGYPLKDRLPVRFLLTLHNKGAAATGPLRLEDELPEGIQVLDTQPAAQIQGRRLVWLFDTLPGHSHLSVMITLQPMPMRADALDAWWNSKLSGVALSFPKSIDLPPPVQAVAPANAGTRLSLQANAPEHIVVGQKVTCKVVIGNQSAVAFPKIKLLAKLPLGVQHPALEGDKHDLEADLDDVQARQQRTAELPLTFTQAGRHVVEITVSADGEQQTTQVPFVVGTGAPLLKLTKTGEVRLPRGRDSSYTLQVINLGQVAARQVMVMDKLAEPLEFQNATGGGGYDAVAREVRWSLGELPAGQTRTLTVTVRGLQVGPVENRVLVQSEGGRSVQLLASLLVEEAAAAPVPFPVGKQ